MKNKGGDEAVKSTTEARQGSRHRANLYALVGGLSLLAILGIALYAYFMGNTPVP